MYVDSHVHFWELERGEYPWIPRNNKVLAQDRLPAELIPALDGHGVEGVILVQAASTTAETDYMLELAEIHPWIMGVVGWLDAAGDTFEVDYYRIRKNPKYCGIRLNGTVFQEPDESRRALIRKRLLALQADGFPVDVLARPHELAAVRRMLEHVNALKLVINHLGIPPLMHTDEYSDMEQWEAAIRELSFFPQVMVKCSGMITQAGGNHPQLFTGCMEHLSDTFGPQRMMYGSDWPVALQRGGYDEAISLFEKVMPNHWNEAERSRVRRSNAMRFYGV